LKKNNDPSDNAITFEDKGFVRISIKDKQLKSQFYSVSKNKVLDEHMIFSEATKSKFPTFLWLFFGLLLLFGMCIIGYLLFFLKRKMRENENLSPNESLIGDD
jgi:hypothetical protein